MDLFGAASWWEPQWWNNNGVMVQGLSTGVLAIVTAIYVGLTAQGHNDAVRALKENVHARLDGQTAVVTVAAARAGQPPTATTLLVVFTAENHGPGPTLVAVESAGVGTITFPPGEALVKAGGKHEWSWSSTEGAEALYSRLGDKPLPAITFRSRSPVTGVVDTHTWEGSLKRDPSYPAFGAKVVTIDGPTIATSVRSYPRVEE